MPNKLTIHNLTDAEIMAYMGINDELRKAERKNPDWPEDLFHQVAILQEEAGEVSKAALDYRSGSGTRSELKTELMQTAAMCIRILKNM